MNAAPSPVDPCPGPAGPQEMPPRSAADRARAELHDEIERVRLGVEEMLAEQRSPVDVDLQRELDRPSARTPASTSRSAAKPRRSSSASRQIGGLGRQVHRAVEHLDERTHTSRQRIDQVEADRARRRVPHPHRHRAHARRPPRRGPRHRRPADQRRPCAPRVRPEPRYSRLERTRAANHSVEMLGSAWTFCGTTIRKLLVASADEVEDAVGLVVLVGGAQFLGVVRRAGRRCRAGPRRRGP